MHSCMYSSMESYSLNSCVFVCVCDVSEQYNYVIIMYVYLFLSSTPVGVAGGPTAPTKDADPFGADPEASITSITSVTSVGKGEAFQYATLSRVRKFEVDGKFVQTKISHTVDVTGHMTLKDNRRYQQIKKQDLHEIRQMQRAEMKEATEFFVKMKAVNEQMEKRHEEKVEVRREGGRRRRREGGEGEGGGEEGGERGGRRRGR